MWHIRLIFIKPLLLKTIINISNFVKILYNRLNRYLYYKCLINTMMATCT